MPTPVLELKAIQDALKTCEMTAELLKINVEEVLVSSTGVIGVPLPMPVMEKGLPPFSRLPF